MNTNERAGTPVTASDAGRDTETSGVSWHVFVLAAIALVTLFARFFHAAFYSFYEDDFFYYALVAKHLVLSHLSSFDGVHLTNGYHPLWMAVVALCYALFPGMGFFIGVQTFTFGAAIVFYFTVLRSLIYLLVPARTARLASLALSLHALLLFRFGMEVTLALPLGVATIAYILSPRFHWSARQTFLYGLLASLTVLSRLDSILLFGLLMAAQTLTAGVPWAERLKRIAIYCAGWFPLLLYLSINVLIFHALLPVSGSAKQLKQPWPPSPVPFEGFILPIDRNKIAFVYTGLVVIALGVTALLRQLRLRARPIEARPATFPILIAMLLFPVLHIALLCLLSDWTVWPWYFYSLIFAVLASAAVLLQMDSQAAGLGRERRLSSDHVLAVLCIGLSAYLLSYAAFKTPRHKIISLVAGFAIDHPGIYAMGDGAGAPAFQSGQPFIQLEGLMMDAQYLKLLRAQPRLSDVLRHYGVDYYVFFPGPRVGSCLMLREPGQSGPGSPTMRGKVCAQPLATTSEEGTQVFVYRASDVLAP